MEQQAAVMRQQSQTFDRQAEIMGRQTDFLRQQTDLSRVQASPKFDFELSDNGFVVRNEGVPVRSLMGFCIPYLSVSGKQGEAADKKVAITGLWSCPIGYPIKSKELAFTPAFPRSFPLMPLVKTLDTSAFEFVEIHYIDALGEARIERYTVSFGGEVVNPKDAPLTVEYTFDLSRFCNQNGSVDEAGLKKALADAIEAVRNR
jgi:hypothetical protein